MTTTCVCCPVREMFLVYVDLDPVPGTFHTPRSASEVLQGILNINISQYNPTMILASEGPHDGRKRVCFVLAASLDPVPGTFHSKESARNVIGKILNDRIPHYNPIVSIARNNTPANNIEGIN